MAEKDNSSKAASTVVVEDPAKTVMQTALESALQQAPSAVGVRPSKDKEATTLLSAGQQKTIAEDTAIIYTTVQQFQATRRIEGKEVHAKIILAMGRALSIVDKVDGRKAAKIWCRSVFNPFKDVDKSAETHAFTTVQVFETKTVVEAKAKLNPGYAQYFRRWEDLGMWEAGLYMEADPKTGRLGENVPTHGVMVHGTSYSKPSEALLAGNTLSDVHQAFKNIIRPSVEVIDDLPSATWQKKLMLAAAKEADNVSIVLRRKQKVGDTERMQKVRQKAEELPDPALLGLISGLVGIMSKRGATVQSIFTKITEIANLNAETETEAN